MARFSLVLVAIALITALTGCSSGVPESSLTVRNAATNLLLATSQTQGVLALAIGQTAQIQIFRTYRNSSGVTVTDDVTQFTNFRWESNTAGASFDQLGNINAFQQGVAVLECKFRSGSWEPWDIVRLTVDVN